MISDPNPSMYLRSLGISQLGNALYWIRRVYRYGCGLGTVRCEHKGISRTCDGDVFEKHLSAHSVRGHPSQFLPHPWSARMAERLLLHQPMV